MSASSTSSSDRPGWRPLGTAWVLLVLLAAVGGLDLWVRARVERPPDIVAERVAPYLASVSGPHVVGFGACHGDAFVPSASEPAWGTGGRVYNLSFRGTTPMEWALALRTFVPERADLRAVAVVYAHDELRAVSDPWEGQVMGLVSWADFPMLVRASCRDLDCAGEVLLRRLWPTWRQRAYLSARFWHAMGVREPTPPPGPVAAPPAEGWFAAGEDPYQWTRKLLAEAQRRGVPALFFPLPPNPAFPAEPRPEAEQVVREGGGEVIPVTVEPPLTAADYLDDRHLTNDGQARFAAGIGRALRARLP